MENRTSICICYIITATLITAFVYSIIHTHFSSITRLKRLREDVDQITKTILGTSPDEPLLPQIDNYVKKRTQGLWDELTTVKKKLELVEENTNGVSGFCKKSPTDLQVIIPEEPNYALKSIGASILHVEDDPYYDTGFLPKFLSLRHESNMPESVLDPSMQLGSCYAFKGQKSVFTIKLSHKILIRSVTVEHIPESASLTGDISNAPKAFFVYGIEDPKNNLEVRLGSFEYNNSKTKRPQTFHLNNERSFKYCKIKVTSNHGHPNHTCIYRIAVHGRLY